MIINNHKSPYLTSDGMMPTIKDNLLLVGWQAVAYKY